MTRNNAQHGWAYRCLSAGNALLLSLAVAAWLPAGLAQAQAQEQSSGTTEENTAAKDDATKTTNPSATKKGLPTRKTPALRMKVFEGMAKAQKAAEESMDPKAGIAVLEAMLKETSKAEKLNAYETAMVYRMIGAIHSTVGNYPKAIEAFKQVIAQENIPYGLEAEIKYMLAQLLMASEDYKGAIKMLNDWFAISANPGADSYILLGQAYLLTEQYDPALKAVEQAMAIAKERGVEPKEQWYLLLRVLHYQKNDFKKTAEVLEHLVRRWPKGEYWVQLAMMYGQNNQEDKQFHALETAYLQGYLKREGELMLLAQLLASRDVPFKAAKVVDEGIRDGIIKPDAKINEFLGEQWRRAQELDRALPELEKAAKASSDGEAYVRLAYVYLARDQYKEAAAAVRNGINKGKLKRPADAEMLLGQALFYNKQFEEAGNAFTRAKKDDKTASVATQWLEYLDREQERQKAIDEYLKKKKT